MITMYEVKCVCDLPSEDLFRLNQFLLGDQEGSWYVVDSDLPLARFKNKEDAENFASRN